MIQYFVIPMGMIKLVLSDGRKGSPNHGKEDVIETGDDNYCLVKIPPQIIYGFKGISSMPAMIANCSDIPHEQNEVEKLDINDSRIPYKW